MSDKTLKLNLWFYQQGRTAYDLAQERRDANIGRIIRKNAKLPNPKYWFRAPTSEPHVMFTPIEAKKQVNKVGITFEKKFNNNMTK